MKNMVILATEYKAIQNKIKALQEEQEQKRNEIIEQMDGQNIVTVGQYTIRNQLVTSERLNTKALKNDYPLLCEEYTEKQETTRFTIG